MANSTSQDTKAKAAQAAAKAAQAAKSSGAKSSSNAKSSGANTPAPAAKAAAKGPQTAGTRDKNVSGLRLGAVILWVLALACEVGAFIMLSKIALNIRTIELTDPLILIFIGFLVADAVFCIIAAQLWKKANHIKPSLNNSAFVRTLWHQLGVIMALVCLIPIGIVFLLKSKEMNKGLRTILLVIIAALFVGTTAASVDYHQPNAEEVAQLQAAPDGVVYWTKWGKSYHFDRNCRAIRNSENVFEGPLGDVRDNQIVDMGGTSAFENNRFDPCDFCALGGSADSGGEIAAPEG